MGRLIENIDSNNAGASGAPLEPDLVTTAYRLLVIDPDTGRPAPEKPQDLDLNLFEYSLRRRQDIPDTENGYYANFQPDLEISHYIDVMSGVKLLLSFVFNRHFRNTPLAYYGLESLLEAYYARVPLAEQFPTELFHAFAALGDIGGLVYLLSDTDPENPARIYDLNLGDVGSALSGRNYEKNLEKLRDNQAVLVNKLANTVAQLEQAETWFAAHAEEIADPAHHYHQILNDKEPRFCLTALHISTALAAARKLHQDLSSVTL